jgi:hypothetical protein
VEGRQELSFDQDFKIVTMDSKNGKWPGKKFSSNLEECVAPPSCSEQDVGDPNLFLNNYSIYKIVASIL